MNYSVQIYRSFKYGLCSAICKLFSNVLVFVHICIYFTTIMYFPSWKISGMQSACPYLYRFVVYVLSAEGLCILDIEDSSSWSYTLCGLYSL